MEIRNIFTKLYILSPRQEVEQYNQQALRFGTVTPATSDLRPKPSDIELDTSKIDPLDLDKWRKLADTALERDDFTQQGHKYGS